MRKVMVAATQMACSNVIQENIEKAESLVRQAAQSGAQIILIQELFENLYFCQTEDPKYFDYANATEDSPLIKHFQKLAKELAVVLPISFFEKKNNVYFNSLVVIDADGLKSQVYRKTHIPDGPGYKEKYYFSSGDTGFKIFKTMYAKIGIGICWDQWFPETARCLALMGAEIILYPTAIGSEPTMPDYDSKDHWQRTMQGHSAANMIPIVASNRIGTEIIDNSIITFYGSSFITNEFGEKIAESNRVDEGIITATVDLDEAIKARSTWGIFRDRRPSMYHVLMTKDGTLK